MPDAVEEHYNILIKAITDGRVVPFFGAGVNLCGRPKDITWQYGQYAYLPSGGELAGYLARTLAIHRGTWKICCASRNTSPS